MCFRAQRIRRMLCTVGQSCCCLDWMGFVRLVSLAWILKRNTKRAIVPIGVLAQFQLIRAPHTGQCSFRCDFCAPFGERVSKTNIFFFYIIVAQNFLVTANNLNTWLQMIVIEFGEINLLIQINNEMNFWKADSSQRITILILAIICWKHCLRYKCE